LQWPRWSPDGTGIAYSNGSAVYLVDVATGETTKVAHGGQPEWLDANTLIIQR
jgi:Tol biopolymer transport system component